MRNAEEQPSLNAMNGAISAKDPGKIFRQVVEQMAEGCIIVDGDGTILFANPAMETISGRSPESLVNNPCLVLFPERYKAQILEVQKEHNELGRSASFKFEVQIEKPDNTLIPALLNGTTVIREHGELDACLVLITDIREQAERVRQLKELDEMKNDFISMVSHELNTPIASASGALSIIGDELYGRLGEDQKKYVAIAARNVERLSRLASDLLSITRIDSRRLSIEPKPLDLRIPVMAACQALFNMTRDRGINLIFPGAASEPVMTFADPGRMEQVVINLVRNAARFASSKVEVKLSADRDASQIIVEDDGPGLYPEDIPNLFNKFYRGQDAKRAGGGTGLGLAIVKGIVEAHRGTVYAENRRTREEWEAGAGDGGARMVVTIPMMNKNVPE